MEKKKKRTTLRKQFSHNIMALVAGILAVFSILIFVLVNMTVASTLNASLGLLGHVASRGLDRYNADEFLINNQDSEIYQNVKHTLETFQSSSRGLIPNVYMVTKNPQGEWVYVFETSSEGKTPVSIGQQYGAENVSLEEAYSTREPVITKLDQDYLSQEAYVTAFVPIVSRGNVTAVVGFDLRADILTTLNMVLILILLVQMAIALLIVWLIVRRITKRQTKSIDMLVNKMREMSDLNGDLTKRIEVDSNNEIGELADYTNKMLDTIQEMFIKVDETSKKLLTSSEVFSASFQQTAASFEVINATTSDVAQRIEEQDEGSRKINQYIVEVSEAVNQVATFSQQVTEEAIKTENNAIDGNETIQQMKHHINNVIKVVDESSESVGVLRGKSNQINSIVDTITAIAGQTNLLALNASIEAARAGEQGRGFVVVAEEVRKLAEESSKSAEEIYKLIQEVQHVIEVVSKSMENVSKKSISSNDYVNNVIERFSYIAESIKNVSHMVEEVSASTEEMAASTSMITSEMGSFTAISAENAASTDGISTQLEREYNNVNDMLNTVAELESVAQELADRLDNLKLS